MAKLTTQKRKNLSKTQFAIPSKAPKSGSYPIPDKSHARNALSRVSANGTPAEKAEVKSAVARKFPGIGKSASHADESSANMAMTKDKADAMHKRGRA